MWGQGKGDVEGLGGTRWRIDRLGQWRRGSKDGGEGANLKRG